MNSPTLNLNLPDGWKLDFKIEPVVSDDGHETHQLEHYIITTKDDDLVSGITISKWLDTEHGCDPWEIIVNEVKEFLDSQNLTEDEYPDLDDYLKTFNIGDIDVYFFDEPVVIDGITIEEAFILHGVFQAPDKNLVFFRTSINKWADGYGEIHGVGVMSRLFEF